MIPIRILIADKHQAVRTHLSARLHREDEFEIVGLAANSQQTLELVQTATPNVLLMDPMMDGEQGMIALEEIAAHLPEIAVVILTTVADTALQIELRKLGVRKILDKEIESKVLIQALTEAVPVK